MSKESAWQHQPDTDDTNWKEICDRNCIGAEVDRYRALTQWEQKILWPAFWTCMVAGTILFIIFG